MLSLADDFLWIKIDIDRQLSIARSYAVEGTPLIVILDPDGEQRVKLLGFQDPAELHDNLTGYLERANATTTAAYRRGSSRCSSRRPASRLLL